MDGCFASQMPASQKHCLLRCQTLFESRSIGRVGRSLTRTAQETKKERKRAPGAVFDNPEVAWVIYRGEETKNASRWRRRETLVKYYVKTKKGQHAGHADLSFTSGSEINF